VQVFPVHALALSYDVLEALRRIPSRTITNAIETYHVRPQFQATHRLSKGLSFNVAYT